MTNIMSVKARRMRREKTEAERRLWWKLRDLNRAGVHFRQQAPISRYIADFCDHSLKLVIEVDGSQHGESAGLAADQQRTAWLNLQGYKVLRFWNRDVLANTEGVMANIMLAAGLLEDRSKPSGWAPGSKADASPPPCGEGLDAEGSHASDAWDSPPPNLPHKGGGTASSKMSVSISSIKGDASAASSTDPRPPCGGGSVAIVAAIAFLSAALGLLVSSPALAAEGASGAVDPFVYRLMVFAMAIFVGYYVVWSVTPALHTPLMSVTNAISSVIVVGALLAVGVTLVSAGGILAKIFGFLALTMASVNIFGGFLVTQRMLAMYKKKDGKK